MAAEIKCERVRSKAFLNSSNEILRDLHLVFQQSNRGWSLLSLYSFDKESESSRRPSQLQAVPYEAAVP